MSHFDDTEAIARVLGGDKEAFGVLIDRYQGLVFTVILKIVGSRETSEELLQEAFFKAYDKLSSLKDRRRFKAWLLQIATNEALCWLRSRNPKVMSVDFSDEKAAALFRDEQRELELLGVEEAAQKLYRTERLGAALDELPITYRTPILLRYYGGLSYKEVAQRMGLSLSAAKFRLHYGVRLLKALATRR